MVVNAAGAKTGLARTDSLTAFRVRRLDDLFGANGAWSGEALAFGHFDVEGAELDLLRGARWVISRDRPIFTVEVPTSYTSYAQQLLDEIASLGYGALVVPEKCGENIRKVVKLVEVRNHSNGREKKNVSFRRQQRCPRPRSAAFHPLAAASARAERSDRPWSYAL